MSRVSRTDRGRLRLANAPERQEADGQRELLESTDLPTDHGCATDREYTALGFAFGEPYEDDPLFRPATLPDGWRREASDHAMGSYLVDEKGRRRVAIFYKAAFHDRQAHMHLLPPTDRLVAAVFGDDEPTGIEVDELLTEDVAREWLTRERAKLADSVALKRAGGGDAGRTRLRLERVDKLLGFLPGTAS